jgi:hypothetical protein
MSWEKWVVGYFKVPLSHSIQLKGLTETMKNLVHHCRSLVEAHEYEAAVLTTVLNFPFPTLPK